jgi:polyisoprenyl-phosphate glycosyltransferase
MAKPVYSIVIPVYNEEESLPELYLQLTALIDRLDGEAEVLLIDDGSSDDSCSIMVKISNHDPRFKVLELSRNFGHQIAITAGMDASSGQAVIIMDADLQDPPEVVLEMAAKWRDGYDVVYGVREERENETWFKRVTAALFYRLLRKLTDLNIPVDVGDFRLVDRKALDAFRSLREHNRYIRGMFSWIGFKQTGVRYRRLGRFAGTTKYPFKKMLKLALDGVLSFSVIPLRLALHFGLLMSALSFVAGLWALGARLWGTVYPGWTSVVLLVTFLGGIQLALFGVLGEYIGRIYDEVRNRPIYLVRNAHGFDEKSADQLTCREP